MNGPADGECRAKIDLVSIQQSKRFEDLDKKSQNIVSSLLDQRDVLSKDIQDQTAAVSQMLSPTEFLILDQHNQTRALFVDALQQANGPSSVREPYEYDLNYRVAESKSSELRITGMVEGSILETLRFPTIGDRYEEIAENHQRTFQWMLRDTEPCGLQPWSNFVSWLREGTGIYWVNGKAGSGKSTLMKYISEETITKTTLSTWAI
jgi:hypothetical protein